MNLFLSLNKEILVSINGYLGEVGNGMPWNYIFNKAIQGRS